MMMTLIVILKTLNQGIKVAKTLAIDYLLLPNQWQLYPDNYTLRIIKNAAFGSVMEDAFKTPGYFIGMLTVVMKLLLLTKVVDEKDYQQLILG